MMGMRKAFSSSSRSAAVAFSLLLISRYFSGSVQRKNMFSSSVLNGDVQEHGLGDLPLLGGLGQQLDVAHHVEAVGYFDEHDSRVAGVGDDKALVVLGLEAGLLGLDGGYLVEALRYVYDFRGKCSFREALRHLRVEPDGLMEKYGNDALVA